MAGAIAIVIVLLIFPTLVLMSGGVASAILGFFLQRDGDPIPALSALTLAWGGAIVLVAALAVRRRFTGGPPLD